MSRLIDADAAIAKPWFVEIKGECIDDIAEQIIRQCKRIVKDAPSIDIVRCRECKYAEVSVSPITGLWCTRFGINDMAMEADDFCSYGERKEDE